MSDNRRRARALHRAREAEVISAEPLTKPMAAALRMLAVEWGAYGAPHPNILRGLVRRELAWLDWGATDSDGVPPQVRRTPAGEAMVAQDPESEASS